MDPIPRAPLSDLLKAILRSIRKKDFYAQDGDYTADECGDVRWMSELEGCADGEVFWLEAAEGSMTWSFHVLYMDLQKDGRCLHDAAVLEIAIGADFNHKEGVDSTVIVKLEFVEDPPGADDEQYSACAQTPTLDAWKRFKKEHLNKALKLCRKLGEAA